MSENIETNMTTEELLAQRHQVYGDRVQNMERVALMWTGYLGFEVRPVDVPAMLALYKMYRLNVEPEYSDNLDDVDGYMQMTREVIGDRLIQARTVDEFITKRKVRDLYEDRMEVEREVIANNHETILQQARKVDSTNAEAIQAPVQNAHSRADRILSFDETEEEMAERHAEERAYGRSMGRSN